MALINRLQERSCCNIRGEEAIWHRASGLTRSSAASCTDKAHNEEFIRVIIVWGWDKPSLNKSMKRKNQTQTLLKTQLMPMHFAFLGVIHFWLLAISKQWMWVSQNQRARARGLFLDLTHFAWKLKLTNHRRNPFHTGQRYQRYQFPYSSLKQIINHCSYSTLFWVKGVALTFSQLVKLSFQLCPSTWSSLVLWGLTKGIQGKVGND